MLRLDGFDDALLGVAERCGQPPLLAYSYDKIVSILVARDEMTWDEAVEFMEFNIAGAWMGPETPLIVRELTTDEWDQIRPPPTP